jgi:hypothetical protein
MMDDVLSCDEKLIFTLKHDKALASFGELCRKQRKENKFKFILPLRNAGFSQKDSIKYKFGTSYRIWRRVKEDRIDKINISGRKKVLKK